MYKGFNLETCQKIWSHYDTNASGLLERDEALAFCNEYCSAHGLGPDQRNHIIASFFKTFDVNTDGSISWEELYGSATITGVFREMLNKMPQVLGLLATDREGVVVGRALSQSLDNDKVRSRDHLFNSQFPLLAEQASKLHIGDNKSITAFFDNMIIIHFDYSPIILTVVGATDANVSQWERIGLSIDSAQCI